MCRKRRIRGKRRITRQSDNCERAGIKRDNAGNAKGEKSERKGKRVKRRRQGCGESKKPRRIRIKNPERRQK